MTINDFEKIVKEQSDFCLKLLTSKGNEYDIDKADRLKSFKEAAAILGTSQTGAIAGMMAKHVVSVFNMCRDTRGVEAYTREKWIEKISDSINYLLILRTAVEEELSSNLNIVYADGKEVVKCKK